MILLELIKFVIFSKTSLRKSDAHKEWLTIMQLADITGSDEGKYTSKQKRSAIMTNSLYVLLFIASGIRMGFSWIFLSKAEHHIIGNTFSNIGNVANLLATVAGLILFQCASYRLANIKLISQDRMRFFRNMKHIRDQQLQSRPMHGESLVEIDRDVLIMSVIAMRIVIVSAVGVVTGMMAINVWYSASFFEIACWITWYLHDLVSSVTGSINVLLFPAIWILTAVCYMRRLDSFQKKIENLSLANRPANHFARMQLRYIRLLMESKRVNQMLACILFVLVSFTTPIATVQLFVSVYSDNIWTKFSLPIASITLTLPAIFLLAFAGRLSGKSNEIHKSIVKSLTHELQVPLNLGQRQIMLQMMEEIGSVNPPLALYSLEGDVCTSYSFIGYLISLVQNYLLLLTFDRLFQLH